MRCSNSPGRGTGGDDGDGRDDGLLMLLLLVLLLFLFPRGPGPLSAPKWPKTRATVPRWPRRLCHLPIPLPRAVAARCGGPCQPTAKIPGPRPASRLTAAMPRAGALPARMCGQAPTPCACADVAARGDEKKRLLRLPRGGLWQPAPAQVNELAPGPEDLTRAAPRSRPAAPRRQGRGRPPSGRRRPSTRGRRPRTAPGAGCADVGELSG